METSPGPGRLKGVVNAGVAEEAWGDLPMPLPRARAHGYHMRTTDYKCGLSCRKAPSVTGK
jgi:hypothetical protein